jgi:phosphoserine aminotransferase
MSTGRVHNFGAGPSMIPLEVLKQIKSGFMEFGGVSILEVYHRSKGFISMMDETCGLVKKVMRVPNNFEVMIIQGGASLQFAMIPLNFLSSSADYAVTGHWAEKAFSEARKVGRTNLAFSSAKNGYSSIPEQKDIKISKRSDYLHITSNNTAFGTQFDAFPVFKNLPLVSDMTSDLFTRELDWGKFSLVYASTQKNAGTAGATIIIVDKKFLKKANSSLPDILSLKAHAKAGSILSTSPVFTIYVTNLVLKWIEENGGLDAMETNNLIKASMIYDVIERSGMYECPAEKNSRSSISVVFDLPNKKLEQKFLLEAAKREITGIAGHRIRGGIRVTLGNAVSVMSVKALRNFMKDFEKSR